MAYPSKQDLEDLRSLVEAIQLEDFTDEDSNYELWDFISTNVQLNYVNKLLTTIFSDLKVLAKNPKKQTTFFYVLEYLSNFPASYEETAQIFGKRRENVYRAIKGEAEKMPWLNELMILQKERFSKGEKQHPTGWKHTEEAKSKITGRFGTKKAIKSEVK